jgi:hypothetical protein
MGLMLSVLPAPYIIVVCFTDGVVNPEGIQPLFDKIMECEKELEKEIKIAEEECEWEMCASYPYTTNKAPVHRPKN